MLEFLFKKNEENVADKLNEIYQKLVDKFETNKINEKRKSELLSLVRANGYLPYPYYKILNELTPAETLLALQIKWKQNGVFKDNKFVFDNNKISVLARNNVKNSDYYSKHTYLRTFKDMKQVSLISPKGLDDNEYMYYNGGIAYRVNGKRYWTSMFEVEFD